MSKRRGDGIYLRGMTWWLDFIHRGERHILRIGSNINRTVAKEIASVERAKILRGEAGIDRKRKDIEFDKAREVFLAWAVANTKPKTAASYAECLQRLSESDLFAGKRLGQITPWLLERYKQERMKSGVRVRQNRELAVFGNLVNRMREFKKYEGETPTATKVKEPQNRTRYLEPEEEAAILRATDEPVRTVILVGINTGLRIKAEVLHLRWADVDLKRGMLTVQAAYAKNGTTRSVPLNSVVREALGRLKKTAASEFVFINQRGQRLRDIDAAFAKAREKAKIAKGDVTPHTTRHTFASRLAMVGVGDRTVQELGGWKTSRMVDRYAHLSPSHKAQAVEKIATAFAAASPDAIHDTGSGGQRTGAVSS